MYDYWQSCILLFINMLFIDGLLESLHDKNEAKLGTLSQVWVLVQSNEQKQNISQVCPSVLPSVADYN